MFSRATASFVRQVDPDGSLIHVCGINDTGKLTPWALVAKRKPIWSWKKPKYHPTGFSLSKVLLGGELLSLGTTEGDFVTYSERCGTFRSGKLETEAIKAMVTLEGHGTSKLQSSFGRLRKKELDINNLIDYSNERLVNMNHDLVKQLEKSNVVLAVVKEVILTASVCSIVENKTNQCNLQFVVDLFEMLWSAGKVSAKGRGNLEVDTDVSMEIPSGTVVAYSVLELEIKKDGHYMICLSHGKNGGFEADMLQDKVSQDSLCVVDGLPQDVAGSAPLNGWLDERLSSLALLPQATRQVLFQNISQMMREKEVLSCLQGVLEDIFLDDTQLHSQHPLLCTLLGVGYEPESTSCDPAALLESVLVVVSAMEELPDETLGLLSESEPEFLEACDDMVCLFKGTDSFVSCSSLPPLLQEIQDFQKAKELFHSASLTLSRDADRVWVDGWSNHGVEMLVLCITLHGLSTLLRK
ncbi:gasdermin-E-like [Synchiropus picturatus]